VDPHILAFSMMVSGGQAAPLPVDAKELSKPCVYRTVDVILVVTVVTPRAWPELGGVPAIADAGGSLGTRQVLAQSRRVIEVEPKSRPIVDS
jgi:hypothetical protein